MVGGHSSTAHHHPLYRKIIMENFGTYFGTQSSAITVTAAALFIFGLAYNWLVDRWHRAGYSDGLTSLLVVAGVAVTVAASGFTIGWAVALLLLLYFVASGLPMALGDLWRYVNARRVERRERHE